MLSRIDGARVATSVARGESVTVEVGGESVVLEPAALLVETASAEGFACAEEGGYLVGLETALTEELVQEGVARELVRTVQEARKDAGLEVSDRIVLDIEGNELLMSALAGYRDYIAAETLTSQWGHVEEARASGRVSHDSGGATGVIRLRKDDLWH